ncbi:MAG: C39 family peptidase [Chloroflexi bacterium]|nr:C39 family peptidase [Chloroflexota bacterium]
MQRIRRSIVIGLVVSALFAGGLHSALADGNIVHVVAWGETLSALSARYGVAVADLVRINQIGKNGWIYAGQRLTIPALTGDPLPDRPAAVRLSGVPQKRQAQSLTCEEAATAMASRGRISEAQLVAVMPRSANPFEGIRGRTNARTLGTLTDYGTYAQGIKRGLDSLGVASRVMVGQPYNAFRAAVIAELRANRPVVWWTTFRQIRQTPVRVTLPDKKVVKLTRWEHSVTLVGFNDAGFYYHDPYDGSVRFVANADFQRVSAYFDNMALVVD